jgi:hypothetical protein
MIFEQDKFIAKNYLKYLFKSDLKKIIFLRHLIFLPQELQVSFFVVRFISVGGKYE